MLAFFLGGIGIHRFYLRQNGKGVLYLLFCWTFIPALISLIDVIGLAVMSEDRFNAKYNREIYLQAQGVANMMGVNTSQLMQTVDAGVRANNAKIAGYAYIPANVQGKGVQLLESVHIIGNTSKIDTLKGRYQFTEKLYDEMISASYKPRYLSDVQVSIDRYKALYYDRIPTEFELSLLLKPDRNALSQYYSINVYRCFMAHYSEQMRQIATLVRQDAKDRRYEKLIDVADDASNELTMNGDLNEQTTQYINEIDAIRATLYKTRYES